MSPPAAVCLSNIEWDVLRGRDVLRCARPGCPPARRARIGDSSCPHFPESTSSNSIPCSPTRKSSRARRRRQFVDEEILPIIEQCNREGKFPVQLVPKMAELGFFGANLKGYGCAEMSNVEYGLVTQELERGDSGLRSFISVQSALVMYPIHAFGSDAQKDKWLPLLQQGKAIGCFGLTEPQFGSNPGGMLTRAVKKGNELRAQRRKDVDHQRLDCRRRSGVGQVRRRKDPRLPRRKRRAPASNPGTFTASIRSALPSPPAWR